MYFAGLDPKKLIDNKTFRKATKLLFSDKSKSNNKIILLEDDNIDDDKTVAETFFFFLQLKNLDIKGYKNNYTPRDDADYISNIIDKFKNHPSIVKIKENVKVKAKFSFTTVNEYDFATEIIKLEIRKPTTLPAKYLLQTMICAHHLYAQFVKTL